MLEMEFSKKIIYIYCNSDPVNATDRTGRKSQKNKEKDADEVIYIVIKRTRRYVNDEKEVD